MHPGLLQGCYGHTQPQHQQERRSIACRCSVLALAPTALGFQALRAHYSTEPTRGCVACCAAQGNHQGGPQLTLADACPTCLRALLQGLVGSDMLAQLREELLDSLAADEVANAGAPELAVGFLVSKTWLTGFRTRQRLTGGSLQPPTAGVEWGQTCRCIVGGGQH